MKQTLYKDVTNTTWTVHPTAVRAAIKKDEMLNKYLGRWSKCSRISGWGHLHGWIQVHSVLVDVTMEPNVTTYETDTFKQVKRVVNNVYSTRVNLRCEYDHAKAGWTDAHRERLVNLLKGFGLTLEE